MTKNGCHGKLRMDVNTDERGEDIAPNTALYQIINIDFSINKRNQVDFNVSLIELRPCLG